MFDSSMIRNNNDSNIMTSHVKHLPKTHGISCTPQNMIYKVPKSIIKTGGSTQNVASVMKPREFGKFLKAFRSPGMTSSNKNSRPRADTSSNYLVSRRLIPATPMISSSQDSDTSSSINVDSAVRKSAECEAKNNDELQQKDLTETNPSDDCENDIANSVANIANPFQPSQRVLRRTPPGAVKTSLHISNPKAGVEETHANDEQLCTTAIEESESKNQNESPKTTAELSLPPPISRVTSGRVQHSPIAANKKGSNNSDKITHTNIAKEQQQHADGLHEDTELTKSTLHAGSIVSGLVHHSPSVCNSKLEVVDGNSTDNSSLCKGTIKSECQESLAAELTQPAPSSRVTHGKVLHSPPLTQQTTISNPSRSPTHSDMFKLLANAFAPADEENVNLEQTRKLQCSPIKKDQKSFSKKIENIDSAQIVTVENCDDNCENVNMNISANSDCSGEGNSAATEVEKDLRTASTSTSFIGCRETCSKSVNTSFERRSEESNDSPADEYSQSPQTSNMEDLAVLKKTHLNQENSLRMELLLQRYYGSFVIQDMLDMKKKVRDEKSRCIDKEIELREGRQRYAVESLEDSYASYHSFCRNENKVERLSSFSISDKKQNTSHVSSPSQFPISNGQISLDFSNVSSDVPDDVIVDCPPNDFSLCESSEEASLLFSSTSRNDTSHNSSHKSSESCGSETNSMPKEDTVNDDSTDGDSPISSHGLRFIPLRSAKLNPAVGYISKEEMNQNGKKRPKNPEHGGCKDVIDQEEPIKKKVCKKKTPKKPKKTTAEECKKTGNASSNVTHPVCNKKVAASTYVTEFFKNAFLYTQSVSEKKNADALTKTRSSKQKGAKAKSEKAPDDKSKQDSQNQNNQTKNLQAKDYRGKNITKPRAINKDSIKVDIVTKSEDTTAGIMSPEFDEISPYENFCRYTRSSVEELLSKNNPGMVCDEENSQDVDAMLEKMWNIQTDDEKEGWTQLPQERVMELNENQKCESNKSDKNVTAKIPGKENGRKKKEKNPIRNVEVDGSTKDKVNKRGRKKKEQSPVKVVDDGLSLGSEVDNTKKTKCKRGRKKKEHSPVKISDDDLSLGSETTNTVKIASKRGRKKKENSPIMSMKDDQSLDCKDKGMKIPSSLAVSTPDQLSNKNSKTRLAKKKTFSDCTNLESPGENGI